MKNLAEWNPADNRQPQKWQLRQVYFFRCNKIKVHLKKGTFSIKPGRSFTSVFSRSRSQISRALLKYICEKIIQPPRWRWVFDSFIVCNLLNYFELSKGSWAELEFPLKIRWVNWFIGILDPLSQRSKFHFDFPLWLFFHSMSLLTAFLCSEWKTYECRGQCFFFLLNEFRYQVNPIPINRALITTRRLC